MPLKGREEEKREDIFIEKRSRERNFENLSQQLSSEDVTARRWAARDLALFKEASRVLLDRLAIENDLSVRESILSSLLAIKDEVAVRGLIELLKSEDALLRNEVIEILKEMPEEVAPYMKEFLSSVDPDIRIFAINIMESLRHPKVLEWLKEVLENDTNVNVCATALDLITEIGTEEFIPGIEKVKERFKEEPYVQFVADLALRRINEGKSCSK